jgi:hypothetical protein
MIVQVEVEIAENNELRLLVRTETTNEIGLTHTQIIPLTSDFGSSFAKLFKPQNLKFEGLTLTAGDELIAKMKEEKDKQTLASSFTGQPTVVEGEIVNT